MIRELFRSVLFFDGSGGGQKNLFRRHTARERERGSWFPVSRRNWAKRRLRITPANSAHWIMFLWPLYEQLSGVQLIDFVRILQKRRIISRSLENEFGWLVSNNQQQLTISFSKRCRCHKMINFHSKMHGWILNSMLLAAVDFDGRFRESRHNGASTPPYSILNNCFVLCSILRHTRQRPFQSQYSTAIKKTIQSLAPT